MAKYDPSIPLTDEDLVLACRIGRARDFGGLTLDDAEIEARLIRRKKKLAELRVIAEAGGMRIRTFEEIVAGCDWSIAESPEVQAWIDDPPVGREVSPDTEVKREC